MPTDDRLDWQEFPDGAGSSPECKQGDHDGCPGIGKSEEHGDEPVFYVWDYHKVPHEV